MAETTGVKAWLVKHIGVSWKTTLIGYVTALILAIQPLLTEDIDFENKFQRNRYIFRIICAAAVAIFGKYAADSAQVKRVDDKVEEMKNE
jgi:hypothetical protein